MAHHGAGRAVAVTSSPMCGRCGARIGPRHIRGPSGRVLTTPGPFLRWTFLPWQVQHMVAQVRRSERSVLQQVGDLMGSHPWHPAWWDPT
jgi:hypothetical protein